MDSNSTDPIVGLDEEPALSLAALEPPGQHPDQPLEVIDWDALEIIVPQEDEGRDEIVDDNRMYEVLGLQAEDEAFKNASEAGTRAESGLTDDVAADDVAADNISDDGNDYLGASIPVDDDIPEETVRNIEPLPDKTQWPDVDLPFVVGAPLGKRGRGRPRKLRMKSCLEGGNSKGKKTAAERGKEADKEADKEAMEAAKQTEKDKKKMIRGKRKCKRCGELGHGETSYKCPLNGTKKRKRKPRKNTTKYGENAKVPTSRKRAKKGENVQQMEEGAAVVQHMNVGAAAVQEWEDGAPVPLLMQSPTKPTMESIIQNSPIRVTRRLKFN
ncbi:hypothetical protein PVAP13_1KG148131 [Panicum virgatum]|uniref:Uncharacterized protein n=1 Tax=Panicum virgatum TaxID=38727 RepID=A0A8T0XJ58_PANVG|nr:hypothetical protein PVAP13_1KG148131 [Panicum virgatum]